MARSPTTKRVPRKALAARAHNSQPQHSSFSSQDVMIIEDSDEEDVAFPRPRTRQQRQKRKRQVVESDWSSEDGRPLAELAKRTGKGKGKGKQKVVQKEDEEQEQDDEEEEQDEAIAPPLRRKKNNNKVVSAAEAPSSTTTKNRGPGRPRKNPLDTPSPPKKRKKKSTNDVQAGSGDDDDDEQAAPVAVVVQPPQMSAKHKKFAQAGFDAAPEPPPPTNALKWMSSNRPTKATDSADRAAATAIGPSVTAPPKSLAAGTSWIFLEAPHTNPLAPMLHKKTSSNSLNSVSSSSAPSLTQNGSRPPIPPVSRRVSSGDPSELKCTLSVVTADTKLTGLSRVDPQIEMGDSPGLITSRAEALAFLHFAQARGTIPFASDIQVASHPDYADNRGRTALLKLNGNGLTRATTTPPPGPLTEKVTTNLVEQAEFAAAMAVGRTLVTPFRSNQKLARQIFKFAHPTQQTDPKKEDAFLARLNAEGPKLFRQFKDEHPRGKLVTITSGLSNVGEKDFSTLVERLVGALDGGMVKNEAEQIEMGFGTWEGEVATQLRRCINEIIAFVTRKHAYIKQAVSVISRIQTLCIGGKGGELIESFIDEKLTQVEELYEKVKAEYGAKGEEMPKPREMPPPPQHRVSAQKTMLYASPTPPPDSLSTTEAIGQTGSMREIAAPLQVTKDPRLTHRNSLDRVSPALSSSSTAPRTHSARKALSPNPVGTTPSMSNGPRQTSPVRMIPTIASGSENGISSSRDISPAMRLDSPRPFSMLPAPPSVNTAPPPLPSTTPFGAAPSVIPIVEAEPIRSMRSLSLLGSSSSSRPSSSSLRDLSFIGPFKPTSRLGTMGAPPGRNGLGPSFGKAGSPPTGSTSNTFRHSPTIAQHAGPSTDPRSRSSSVTPSASASSSHDFSRTSPSVAPPRAPSATISLTPEVPGPFYHELVQFLVPSTTLSTSWRKHTEEFVIDDPELFARMREPNREDSEYKIEELPMRVRCVFRRIGAILVEAKWPSGISFVVRQPRTVGEHVTFTTKQVPVQDIVPHGPVRRYHSFDLTPYIDFGPNHFVIAKLGITELPPGIEVSIEVSRSFSAAWARQQVTDEHPATFDLYGQFAARVGSIGPIAIPLADPRTGKRLVLPVRGIECDHFETFDFETHLAENETTGQWLCPFVRLPGHDRGCDKYLPPSNLAICRYTLDEVLPAAPEDWLEVPVDINHSNGDAPMDVKAEQSD